MPKLDVNKANITILLSDRSVQHLLDIMHQHPDWTNRQIYENQPRNFDEAPALSYPDVLMILQRLRLNTAGRRRLLKIDVDSYERAEKKERGAGIVSLYPHFISYLQYRKLYHRQQRAYRTLERASTKPLAPVPSPVAFPYTPHFNFTSSEQTHFAQYDRFFFLSARFSYLIAGILLFLTGGSLVLDVLFGVKGLFAMVGMFFSFTAFTCGLLFLLYSLKYYLTIALLLSFSRSLKGEGQEQQGSFLSRVFGFSIDVEKPGGTDTPTPQRLYTPLNSLSFDLTAINLKRHPFVSIQVATYNEKRVIDRFLLAATSIEYDNFEIIVADDSNDETVQLLEQWKTHPRVKISHRETREGFKGGALAKALVLTDPRAEFILVFDADFIPYPDCIQQFLKHFQAMAGSLDAPALSQSNIAAIQGYQWHILNKSENWITRGVRTEYAGSYVMERSGEEVYGGLKQISGSVYMIRVDVLKSIGWGTSITEDFELTLRLYELGYKVLYTPYIQTPAEAASTLKRLIRQRMRWAEGHSFNVKKMFARLLVSPRLTLSEKLEFLYLAPYYLQAFLFLVGTLCWFLAEVVFRVRLPFWTEVWGWSLVLTNLFALPLMNLIGLFMEGSEELDYLGLISFIFLSYIIAPFQAFAAVKGFLENEEGPWFRTPKTGRITDSFVPGRFYRFVKGILGTSTFASSLRGKNDVKSVFSENPYFALASAVNPLDPPIANRRQGMNWRIKGILAMLLVTTMLLNYVTFSVPQALALDTASVQTGSVNIANGATNNTATLGTAVDTSKSILTLSVKNGSGSTSPGCTHVMGDFTSYGASQTGLTFTRQASSCTSDIVIKYSVTTFTGGVTVQRGVTTVTATSTNVTLNSSVNITNSFPIISHYIDGTSWNNSDYFRAEFTNLTGNLSATLNLNHADVSTDAKVAWQVVTYTNSSVQTGVVNVTAGSTSATATISSVNLSASWLIFYTYFNSTSTSAANQLLEGKFDNATTINFTKGDSTNTVEVRYYVITFTDNTTVQSGQIGLSTAQTSNTSTITAVNLTSTILTAGGLNKMGGQTNYTGNDIGAGNGNLVFDDASTVNFTRGQSLSSTHLPHVPLLS